MTPQLWIAFGLTLLVVIFLMVAFFAGKSINETQRTILKFLCALCSGFAAGLFVGEAFFKMETSGVTKITVTGTAGFALFFVVWYGFGKYVAPDAFAFSVTNGWTFENTARAIAQEHGALVDFDGLTSVELAEPLQGVQLQVKAPVEALRNLRNLAKANSIRPYEVDFNKPTYSFRVIA